MTEAHGERTWDDVLDATGLEGAYTAVASYPDDDLARLVDAVATVTGESADGVLVWFGRSAIPLLAARYPQVFADHASTRSFVLTLNDVIHPAVRKLFPGAYAPSFEFDTSREDGVSLGYHSTRDLCRFAEGLVLGAAVRFGETAEVVHEQCTRHGEPVCVLGCTFRPSVA